MLLSLLCMTLAPIALCADAATVTKLNTVLRDQPSDTGEKVLVLNKKSVLALVDIEDTDGWLNVIHVKSGKEGWVKAKHVSVTLSRTHYQKPIFAEEKIDDSTSPEIYLENASNKALTLKVGEERFEIPSNNSKTITITPGNYKYHASAPGVFPAIGKNDFRMGYRYSWKFWIERR